jgi:hypothetical protein
MIERVILQVAASVVVVAIGAYLDERRAARTHPRRNGLGP